MPADVTRCGVRAGAGAMEYQEAKARAEVLKALAHPTRLLLVDLLRTGEKCVMALLRVAEVDGSTISRHLERLKAVGIVDSRRDGQKIIYRLAQTCVLGCVATATCVLKTDSRRLRQALKGVAG